MPAKINEKALEEVQKAFTQFDKDNNGFIDQNELEILFKQLKFPFTSESLKHTFSQLDKDNNNQLDFEELKPFLLKLQPENKEDEMQKMFQKFDQNNSGFIDLDELKETLLILGHLQMEDDELMTYMEVLDLDGDNKINFEEFKKYVGDLL